MTTKRQPRSKGPGAHTSQKRFASKALVRRSKLRSTLRTKKSRKVKR